MKINLISYAKLAGEARGFRIGRCQGQRRGGGWGVCWLGHFVLKKLKNSKTGWLERKGRRKLTQTQILTASVTEKTALSSQSHPQGPLL